MSEIQEVGLRVSKLVSDSTALATQLLSLAGSTKQMSERLQGLMDSTVHSNYQDIAGQMRVTQKQLLDAARILTESANIAKTWLSKHITSASTSGTSTPDSITFTNTDSLDDTDSPTNDLPFRQLSEYMSAHNYGQADYAIYSQDPVWRVLHRAAFPNAEMPPINRQVAILLLNQYMAGNNYGQSDYGTYSSDPVWQELNRYAFPDMQAPLSRPNPEISSSKYASIVSALRDTDVPYQQVEPYGRYRSSEEIVERLGGGDRTDGSCSSLAFAYIGNRAGYDVLDFRDGQSRRFFSTNNSIDMIANLPGVTSTILYGVDDIACTNTLLASMQEGKEYYLATGQHAAMVRRMGDHYEFLELQSSWSNGWKPLDDNVLLNRFGCETSQKYQYPNFLIDADSLLSNHEFLDILGYLNTAETEQRKGVGGFVK